MSDEHDSFDRDRSRPRILWGRVAFYGLSLLLVFALGNWSATDDTADAELDEARAELDRLAQENVSLRAEKAALEARGVLDAEEASSPDGSDPDATAPDGSDPDATAPDGSDPDGTDPDGSDPSVDDGDGETRAAEATEPGEPAEEPDPAEQELNTYVVRQGDTGLSIAEAVYGDGDLWPLIADANGLEGANALQVDQELVIPPSE